MRQGKITMGHKLLKEGGDESMLCSDEIEGLEVRSGGESCTHKIYSIFWQRTGNVKAVEVVDTPGFVDSYIVKRLRVYKAILVMFCKWKIANPDPSRRSLECADGVLQKEIKVMHHFFGNTIFDCMVHASCYSLFSESNILDSIHRAWRTQERHLKKLWSELSQ